MADGDVEYGVRVKGERTIRRHRDHGDCIRSAAGARRAAREDWAPGVAEPVKRTVGPWVEVPDERCPALGPSSLLPCVLPAGHEQPHRTNAGVPWTTEVEGGEQRG